MKRKINVVRIELDQRSKLKVTFTRWSDKRKLRKRKGQTYPDFVDYATGTYYPTPASLRRIMRYLESGQGITK